MWNQQKLKGLKRMREVFDGYLCELEDCVKPEAERNNCAECGYCVSMEDVAIAQAEATE